MFEYSQDKLGDPISLKFTTEDGSIYLYSINVYFIGEDSFILQQDGVKFSLESFEHLIRSIRNGKNYMLSFTYFDGFKCGSKYLTHFNTSANYEFKYLLNDCKRIKLANQLEGLKFLILRNCDYRRYY